MKRLVQCDYLDLRTGETWTRLFYFDAVTGERLFENKEMESAPVPNSKRHFWEGKKR